jgi:hypothetical protein
VTEDVLDRLITTSEGQVMVDLDDVTYWATPLERLDENLRTCLPIHRDALLDVRLHLYR